MSKWSILKCPISYVLNFRGWIKLIYDKSTLIYCVKDEFNLTSEVLNIENRVFQNAAFANARFPNRDYSWLWALSGATKYYKKIQILGFSVGEMGLMQHQPNWYDPF